MPTDSQGSGLPEGPRRISVGKSPEGRPIEFWRRGDSGPRVLVLGVFHGDEAAGEYFCRQAFELCPEGIRLGVVPVVNPDGLARACRQNGRGVDLNRNFPTQDWTLGSPEDRYYGGPSPGSEPETQLLLELLEKFWPERALTVHSDLKNVNFDGPAEDLATRMAELTGYPLAPDIGYPTPGSFGTYLGREREVPTITLELNDESGETLWPAHREAVRQFLLG